MLIYFLSLLFSIYAFYKMQNKNFLPECSEEGLSAWKYDQYECTIYKTLQLCCHIGVIFLRWVFKKMLF